LIGAAKYFFTKVEGTRQFRLTVGPRVTVDGVRSAFLKLSAKVRRLNERKWFKELGEVLLRCSEVTYNGDTFHVHCHIVVRAWEPLDQPAWLEVRGKLRKMFGGDTEDCGPVKDAEGLIGYLFKGNDPAVLDMDPTQLAALMSETEGLRTHEPLGEFRCFCCELNSKNLKIAKSGAEFVVLNRSDGNAKQTPRAGRARPTGQPPSANKNAGPAVQPENLLVRIGQPVAHFTNRLEPRLFVVNYDGDFSELLERYPDLQALRLHLLPKWTGSKVKQPSIVPLVQQSTARPIGPADLQRINPTKLEANLTLVAPTLGHFLHGFNYD
jgi:hypothetical protein